MMSSTPPLSTELIARVALEKHGFQSTHSLGQNFLLSEGLIGALLDEIELSGDDNVLEIGPGAGVMTRLLAQRCRRVLAVELDNSLRPVLNAVLEGMDNVSVIYEDILRADIDSLVEATFDGQEYRVVANLPYYITADTLLRLCALSRLPVRIAAMLQKEAAERIMASPGSKKWCALAAELQYYGQVRLLQDVPPEAFEPSPHVVSSFVSIERHPLPVVVPMDDKLFHRVIHAAFAMRRKTLVNNLKAAFGLDRERAEGVIEAAGFDGRVRGEALTLEELCRVADAISRDGIAKQP